MAGDRAQQQGPEQEAERSHPPREHKAESEPHVEGGCELKSSPVMDFFQQGCTS